MGDQPKKRALIMAGGGVKVAFQAGVLQVWLDEAGIKFDHADGASGGLFNLAMYCQEMSGKQIADNWRKLDPSAGVALNWSEYARLFYAESLFSLDNYRKKVFPAWGLDWKKIRESRKEATFNVYNFSRHRLKILAPDEMNEDYLVAGVSLPMWFPPVEIQGETYIDSVFITDGNIEEAVRRGADEIWVVWTVSEAGEWRDGFVANYFQIIETAANGHFYRIVDRIDENNRKMDEGETGEFGRRIEMKILRAEVPLHYLINFSGDRVAESVNRGVNHARRWCEENGIGLKKMGPVYSPEIHTVHTELEFTEEMKGFVGLGETDFEKGFKQGKINRTHLLLHLTIQIDGVNRFVTHPDHEALITGYVECPAFGGKRSVENGVFNLFVDEGAPENKRMWYLIYFSDEDGKPITLVGFKIVEDDPGVDLWQDTTTLFTKIYSGRLESGDAEKNSNVLASGIIRIHLTDFLKQLTTFRVKAPTYSDKVATMSRFGKMFLGKLWDVYAKDILTYAPF